jgi:hypothetical protein
MSTKFFTNSEENTLINKFAGVFTYNPHIQYFDDNTIKTINSTTRT